MLGDPVGFSWASRKAFCARLADSWCDLSSPNLYRTRRRNRSSIGFTAGGSTTFISPLRVRTARSDVPPRSDPAPITGEESRLEYLLEPTGGVGGFLSTFRLFSDFFLDIEFFLRRGSAPGSFHSGPVSLLSFLDRSYRAFNCARARSSITPFSATARATLRTASPNSSCNRKVKPNR